MKKRLGVIVSILFTAIFFGSMWYAVGLEIVLVGFGGAGLIAGALNLCVYLLSEDEALNKTDVLSSEIGDVCINDENKINSIEYCKFRDTYKKHETQKMYFIHKKIGGLTSWNGTFWHGTSDENIYEAFLKGEQHEDPLIKELEELRSKTKKHYDI